LARWFWVFGAAGALLALYGLHRLARWMEARGWIYYRSGRGSAAVGNALQALNAIYLPEENYAAEVKIEKGREQDDQGDPVEPWCPIRKDEVADGPDED
jgi:hypothetical protein